MLGQIPQQVIAVGVQLQQMLEGTSSQRVGGKLLPQPIHLAHPPEGVGGHRTVGIFLQNLGPPDPLGCFLILQLFIGLGPELPNLFPQNRQALFQPLQMLQGRLRLAGL